MKEKSKVDDSERIIKGLRKRLEKAEQDNLKLKKANYKLRKICQFFATDNLELLRKS